MMRQVVPVFTRFVQMPFARDARLTQSKRQSKATNQNHVKDANLHNGHENGCRLCLRSMSPGTIAGKGKIISIGARLDAP